MSMPPSSPLSLSVTLERATKPPATTTILDLERLSERLLAALGDMLAWTPQARLFPAFWAAEVFRRAGFPACVVQAAVTAYCAARSGDDPQDIATDILANLRLWCMARNLDFDRCLRRAEMHVAAELREECG
jgi:hypothetical protein